MSDFDASKDKVLFTAGSIDLTEKVRIEVTVRSYDGGPSKVSILKHGKKADGSEWTDTKPGRLGAEQTTMLSLFLVAAAEFISKPVQVAKPTVRKRVPKTAQVQPTV